MDKTKKTKIFLFLSIVNTIMVNAQTINSGELSVKQGTIFSSSASFDNAAGGDVLNDGTLILYSDYRNDGLMGFSAGSGTGMVHFKGSAGVQTISGSIISRFNNVRFDNSKARPAFLLSADISIMGYADFSKGIVENSSYPGAVIFEKDATHDHAGNDSYVSGFAERNQNGLFEFPIGDGGYFRPCSIGEAASQNGIFRCRYLLKNSNLLFPHSQKEAKIHIIGNTEYWEFESSQKNIETALTLTWSESTTPADIIENKQGTTLAVVRWDEKEKNWHALPTALDSDSKKAVAAVKEDGVYTLGRVFSETADDLIIYNALSPNEDGFNDYLRIDGLEVFPDNTLEIYNRWGVKVYETSGYGLNNNFFRGFSEGRATFNKGERLPSGTYFYVLTYKNTGRTKEKAGYLYIN